MSLLSEIAQSQPNWLLEEFVDVANKLLPDYLPTGKSKTKVRDEVNPRLVRHYASQGLIDEPLKEGKYAIYTYRHLLQLVLLRRLLSEGLNTSAISALTTVKSNSELENLLTGGVQVAITPANPALAYLQQLKKNNVSAYRNSSKPTMASVRLNASQWQRIEVLPGLEIHIRADFHYPTTPSEKELLKQQLLQKIQDFFE